MRITVRELKQLVREVLVEAGAPPDGWKTAGRLARREVHSSSSKSTQRDHVLYANVTRALHGLERKFKRSFVEGGWTNVRGGICVYLTDALPASLVSELVRQGFDCAVRTDPNGEPELIVKRDSWISTLNPR